MAKIADIADNIWRDELDQDSSVSIASIAAWLRFGKNLGDLNNLLHTDYTIDTVTLEIVDSNGIEITNEAVSIYKTLYMINWYERQTKKFLGVGGVDQVLEVSSDGGIVRMVNRNEMAKSYIQLRKDAKQLLDKLINSYKINSYRPQQVIGKDLILNISSIIDPSRIRY